MHNMDYHRSSLSDGIYSQHLNVTDNNMMNVTNDCFYASDYWNIPYTNGLTPMKQIEGTAINWGILFDLVIIFRTLRMTDFGNLLFFFFSFIEFKF